MIRFLSQHAWEQIDIRDILSADEDNVRELKAAVKASE